VDGMFDPVTMYLSSLTVSSEDWAKPVTAHREADAINAYVARNPLTERLLMVRMG
jgi:hypothetical protein